MFVVIKKWNFMRLFFFYFFVFTLMPLQGHFHFGHGVTDFSFLVINTHTHLCRDPVVFVAVAV